MLGWSATQSEKKLERAARPGSHAPAPRNCGSDALAASQRAVYPLVRSVCEPHDIVGMTAARSLAHPRNVAREVDQLQPHSVCLRLRCVALDTVLHSARPSGHALDHQQRDDSHIAERDGG
jgi:hypothetical protein